MIILNSNIPSAAMTDEEQLFQLLENEAFIFHPTVNHSHQIALALHEIGILKEYWSGLPISTKTDPAPRLLPKWIRQRYRQIEIPKEKRRLVLRPKIELLLSPLLSGRKPSSDYMHHVLHAYDLRVSRRISLLKPKVVIGTENACALTFAMAKNFGACCILDAPSLHHSTGEKILGLAPTPLLAKINKRKDDEIRLADKIITCSPLAMDSYISAKVPIAKLRFAYLGANLQFQANISTNNLDPAAPLKFIFAGAISYRKGIDVLIDAFSRLHAENHSVQLICVGGIAERKWQDALTRMQNVVVKPSISQQELLREFDQADCLVLPSRFDSFGMVVAEGMSRGLPAIVSTNVGAKALIEQDSRSGWIIPFGSESLYQCIRERLANRAELAVARLGALEAAKAFTWECYRARLKEILKDTLSSYFHLPENKTVENICSS